MLLEVIFKDFEAHLVQFRPYWKTLLIINNVRRKCQEEEEGKIDPMVEQRVKEASKKKTQNLEGLCENQGT